MKVNIVDDGRVFVPAGGVTAEALAEALRAQHTADKYPHHHVDFRVVKDRVEAVISGYPRYKNNFLEKIYTSMKKSSSFLSSSPPDYPDSRDNPSCLSLVVMSTTRTRCGRWYSIEYICRSGGITALRDWSSSDTYFSDEHASISSLHLSH